MHIDPKHLIQLAEIIDSGSFTEAAHRLNTSQPALSRMASELERRLAAPIFSSRRNPIVATALGRELADHGRSIRASYDRVARLTDRVASGDHGELSIGAPPFHIERLISSFVAEWMASRPGVRVVLRSDYAPSLLTHLIDGEMDLILAPVQVIEGIPNLIVERLSHGANVIVCRAGHPLLDAPEITAQMLSQARWISHARESLLHRDMRLALSAAGVAFIELPSFESNSASAVRNLLANSDMLTMLPELIAGDLVGSGGYAILPFELTAPRLPFGYIAHEARQSPVLRAFCADLEQFVRIRDAEARAVGRAAFARMRAE
jgi:DNA-binding transcriptional LysR family regulator